MIHKRVINETEAAQAVGLSLRTMQRLRQDGGGPQFVKLTTRRIGYTDDALTDWLGQRAAASTSAVTVARNGKAK